MTLRTTASAIQSLRLDAILPPSTSRRTCSGSRQDGPTAANPCRLSIGSNPEDTV
jgi:hypothetical protein